MSVLSLSKHTARIMRSTEAKSAYRDVVRTWSPNVASVACEIEVATVMGEDRTHMQGGEITKGNYNCFIHDIATDVVEGDVLDTLSGPNHPLTVEVVGVWNVRNHHLELRLENWQGSLT